MAILNAVGIELHQVTFAGLVVALGIVVDDAIVVVDNYVEKLDHGMSRLEAAWRSPTELAVPVLAATLTIVASFMPLAYLPGAPGEFIRAMSYTVAIALMVSFAVAMLLTPHARVDARQDWTASRRTRRRRRHSSSHAARRHAVSVRARDGRGDAAQAPDADRRRGRRSSRASRSCQPCRIASSR